MSSNNGTNKCAKLGDPDPDAIAMAEDLAEAATPQGRHDGVNDRNSSDVADTNNPDAEEPGAPPPPPSGRRDLEEEDDADGDSHGTDGYGGEDDGADDWDDELDDDEDDGSGWNAESVALNTIRLLNKNEDTHLLYDLEAADDWDQTTTDNVAAAARTNTSVRELVVYLMDRRDVPVEKLSPIIELLGHPRQLDSLHIDSGTSLHINAYLEALRSNTQSTLRCLKLKYCQLDFLDHRPDLFKEFMEMAQMHSLSFEGCDSLSGEGAGVLADTFQNMSALRSLEFNMGEDEQDDCTYSHFHSMAMLASLHGHPNLTTLDWSDNLDPGVVLTALSLGETCPNLQNLFIRNVGNNKRFDHALNMRPSFNTSMKVLTLENFDFEKCNHCPPKNDSLETLHLIDCNFPDNAPGGILQFPQVKNLHFKDHCSGVASIIEEVCNNFLHLEMISLCELSHHEDQEFAAMLPRLMVVMPQKIHLNCCFNHNFWSNMALGLSNRSMPLKELELELVDWHVWKKGWLDCISRHVLPEVKEVEKISLRWEAWNGPQLEKSVEVHCFLESILSMEKLHTFELGGYTIKEKTTADMIVQKMKDNNGMKFFDVCLSTQLESNKRVMDFYLLLNQYDRQMLKDNSIPLSYWPHILSKLCSEEEFASMSFFFLKALNSGHNIFTVKNG